MTKRKVVIGMAITILIIASVFIFAQGQRSPGGRGHGMGMKGLCQDLDLTAEQQTKMIDLKFSHDQEMLTLRKDLMKKKMEFKAELDKENPNVTLLDKISDEMSALKGKMKKSKLHHILSMKTILSREQWLKAKEHLMERAEGGPGPGPGCGPEMGRGPNGRPPEPPPPPDAPPPPGTFGEED